MFFHERKNPRITGYDYTSENHYFVTICTDNKKCIFGKPNHLNVFGNIARDCITKITNYYPYVLVDKFVVMPNHIHLILCFSGENKASLSQVIGQYKMAVTKQIHQKEKHFTVWQRSFHDHVIRDRESYEKIWNYIDGNPGKWEEDCFYIAEQKDKS